MTDEGNPSSVMLGTRLGKFGLGIFSGGASLDHSIRLPCRGSGDRSENGTPDMTEEGNASFLKGDRQNSDAACGVVGRDAPRPTGERGG